jgi:phage-related protein
MALAELRTRLNASEVVTSFASQVRDPIDRLQQLAPVDAGGSGSLPASGALDLSSLTNLARRLAEQLAAELHLPDPTEVLGAIETIVTLVEEIDPRALDASVRRAIDQIAGELKKPRDSAFTDLAERLVGMLTSSPEGKTLLGLLTRAIQFAGIDAKIVDEVKSLLPSLVSVIRAIGGILRVESALSEAERLTALMQSQLTGDAAAIELTSLTVSFDYAVDRLRAAATDATVEVEAERATFEALKRLDLTRESVARRFAFAESTLLFADLAGTVRETQAGLDDAQGVDLAAAGASIGKLVDRVMPAFSIPLPPSPADSFDALLALIEAQVQAIARLIEAVDVTKIGAPVATLTNAVTNPIRQIEQIGTDLTQQAQGAIESVAQLVSSLPTGEIVQVVDTVTAPVRAAMNTIDGVVQGAQAGVQQLAAGATEALGDAEQAVDGLANALQAVMNAAVAFVRDLHIDAAVGELHERLDALRSALEQASVRPYFSAAVDAIGETASVLEKVPVALLPDDIKQKFDELVDPIRTLDIDAAAAEVESWFELQDGSFPFEPTLRTALADVQSQLETLITDVEPFNPRNLGETVDAELAPLRDQIARIDVGPIFAPIEQAIDQVKQSVAGIDPRGALAPVNDAMSSITDKLDEFSPSKLLAPVQERIVTAREAVIDTLRLEAASQGLTDLQREAIVLITRLDPVQLEPMIATGLDAARAEVATIDHAIGDALGTIVSSLIGGGGARQRPATWTVVIGFLRGDEAASRLRLRAQNITDAVAATATAAAAMDVDAAGAHVATSLRDPAAALAALPADAPLRLRLTEPVARRGTDGGFAVLSGNRARFASELAESHASTDMLLQLQLARVDVTAAALQAVGGPVTRLRNQIFGVLRQLGIRSVDQGLGGILAEILQVATPERLAGVIVPVFTAIRGRAEALLASVIDPLRAAIDEVLSLIRLIDLTKITQALDDVLNAGKAQIDSLNPVKLLEPSLAAFDQLKTDVLGFDPLAPVKQLVDTLKATIQRVLDKLDVERLLEPAAKLFDDLLTTLRSLDVDSLVSPLLDALHTLASDIKSGLDQLRDALDRLQAAIPSSDGLALAGAISGDIDIDSPF